MPTQIDKSKIKIPYKGFLRLNPFGFLPILVSRKVNCEDGNKRIKNIISELFYFYISVYE